MLSTLPLLHLELRDDTLGHGVDLYVGVCRERTPEANQPFNNF